jgi:uncharacterized pyridoxal phosphate-containing UPF0001 family protein
LVETIDSSKLAEAIDRALGEQNVPTKLNVFVQVNTSQESSKSNRFVLSLSQISFHCLSLCILACNTDKNGVESDQVIALVKKIQDELNRLNFAGLMTIGSFDHVHDQVNPDFQKLVECRDRLCSALSIPTEQVELSMGMSSDYELAVRIHSNLIF